MPSGILAYDTDIDHCLSSSVYCSTSRAANISFIMSRIFLDAGNAGEFGMLILSTALEFSLVIS